MPDWVTHSMHLDPVAPDAFSVPWKGGSARVIGLVPGEIVTESLVDELAVENGAAVADPARDLAKVAVLERHLETGRIGLGFVRGFGIRRGAFGATFAHDAHNVIVVERLRTFGGGLVVADGERVQASCRCPSPGCSPICRCTTSSPRAARSTRQSPSSASCARRRCRYWRSSRSR